MTGRNSKSRLYGFTGTGSAAYAPAGGGRSINSIDWHRLDGLFNCLVNRINGSSTDAETG